MRKPFVTCLLALLLGWPAAGFSNPIVTYLGIEQGLSNNSVRTIYKDSKGFMWFGTYDGLCRYDGYSFTVFRNRINDSLALPHNYVYTVGEDQQHHILVGTGQGVSMYDPLTSQFHTLWYKRYDSARTEKLTVTVNVLKTDSRGQVFIGSNGWGLLILPRGATTAIQLPLADKGAFGTEYNVRDIEIDEDQRIWLSIQSVGLCLYNPSTRNIQVVYSDLKAISCIRADRRGRLWLGTRDGLYCYDTRSHAIIHAFREGRGQLSSGNVASLCLDRQQDLWVGTEGGGVSILHINTQTFDYILPGVGKKTLTSESVYAIFEDDEQRKWMGTLKGGINIWNGQKDQFQTIGHDPLNGNSLVNNFASCFFEDEGQQLWIGTDGGGLSIWNRKKDHFTHLVHQPSNEHSLSSNQITSIVRDEKGAIWISTFGGGINKMIGSSHSFEHYQCINDATGEENKNITRLFLDRDKNLWATTFSLGKLYRFNPQYDRFKAFDQQLTDLFALCEDRTGGLWAGNSHQLIKIDKENHHHLMYEIGKPVRSLCEDSKGNFWIGTEGGGLLLFDRRRGVITARFSDADGLCNNAVLTILEDRRGHLWLSTFNGLSDFDPDSRRFINRYQDDGLQSNQFLFNAARQLRSGEFVFGGINGFSIFYPDSLRSSSSFPPVYITGLRINNRPVTDKRYISRLAGDLPEALTIPYRDAILSIDFAALEYARPRKIRYAYYLQGWDKGWNYSGRLRTANYTNIGEGNYMLHIKATNAEGQWNMQEVQLAVTVLPPWYRSWWAYALYLLLAGGTIYFYLRYKARQATLLYEVRLARLNEQKERVELERERTEREKVQAQQARTEAEYLREKAERETERVINEKEREVNEKRLSFFTYISHEFRTPLTLIINPLRDLLKKNQGPDQRQQAGPVTSNNDADSYHTKHDQHEQSVLATAYQNARRLLSLVDQLLLFRKAEAVADQLHMVGLDFCGLCKEVYLAFVQQAASLHIAYEFNSHPARLELYADREKMEIVLYNLIANALKYTPPGGRITLSMEETDEEAIFSIADTGSGIAKEVGDQLFERFFQFQHPEQPAKPGFGIGLYLVKQFAEAHGGRVHYTSELGQGTTFLLHLPKNKKGECPAILPENQEPSGLLQELLDDKELPAIAIHDEAKQLEALIDEQPSLMVIDDDQPIRQYIEQIFSDRYTVYQASSGAEGWKLAKQFLPDLIISDISMEGMSGLEFCKSVKEDPALSHIPVILLTGLSNTETRLAGAEGRADDYITKPFDRDLLVARVATILKNRTSLQKYFYNEITLQSNPHKIPQQHKEFLDRCIAIVEAHLGNDQFNIKVLASELQMSHSGLYKRIKSVSGQSVNAFIRLIRLRKAAELFIHTNNNVNETAFQVGFSDVKYFREHFGKLFGLTPSEYIRKYRKPFSKSFHLHPPKIQKGRE